MEKRCSDYVGVTCVNGGCPNAMADEYPEYGYEHCSCDECGYILAKPSEPDDTTSSGDDASAGDEQDGQNTPQANGGAPSWVIILISCFGGIIAVCGAVLALVLKKKK